VAPSARLAARRFPRSVAAGDGLQRIGEVPIYRIDGMVRRAPSLQRTRDNMGPVACMNPREAQRQGVGGKARVRVFGAGESVALDFLIDRRIPDGCVWIPAGYPETVALGTAAMVRVEVEP
jgi:NADH-quinone oxidoreductase subunit G